MRDENCRLCPLYVEAQTVCIEGDGEMAAPIWFVGEAPGREEDKRGLPFVGPSGSLLRQFIDEAELRPEQYRITNGVRCRPPGNRTPTKAETRTCSQAYLIPEIEEYQPEYIVAVGANALNIFTTGAITRKRGSTEQIKIKKLVKRLSKVKKFADEGRLVDEEVTVAETTLFPIIHPAAALYDPSKEPLIRDDIKTLSRIISMRGQEEEVDYRKCETADEIKASYRELKNEPVLSVDIETYGEPSGFDPRNKGFRILSISLSPRRGVSHVWLLDHHAAMDVVDRSAAPSRSLIQRALTKLLENNNRKLIFHNGLFDCVCIEHYYGVKPNITFDTMIAAYLFDENAPIGLKDLAKRFCGAGDYSEDIDWGSVKRGLKAPPWEKLWFYNARDTDYTFRLYEFFKTKFDLEIHRGLRRLYTRLMLPALRVLIRMRLGGLWIDRDRLIQRSLENRRMMQQHEAELLEYVPDTLDGPLWSDENRANGHPRHSFNIRANRHLQWLFFEHLGMPIVTLTKSGEPQLDKPVLMYLQENHPHPALDALVAYKKRAKYQSTYFDKYERDMNEEGWVFPQYKLAGKDDRGGAEVAPVTGRLSGDYQQIPRDKFIRGLFGAPPGWKFIECDLSQIELRLIAHASQDPTLVNAYRTGQDVHRITASNATTKPVDEITGDERTLAKGINFGLAYGMAEDKLSGYIHQNYGVKISYQEAQIFRRRHFKLYGSLLAWHKRQKLLARKYGRVKSPIGRIRRLPGIKSSDYKVASDSERQAINSPIQGFGSDINLMGMILIQKEIDRVTEKLGYETARIVLTLHDAVMLIARDGTEEWWAKKARKIMANPPLKEWFGVELSVPLDAEYTIGQHWKD